MINISVDQSIFKLISKYPDIKKIMLELGFKDIVKPGMLQSVGRIMTIKKGCSMKKIDFQIVKDTFLKSNYYLTED